MGDLSQAQVIGGAVVTVGADTRGLHVGMAETKATAATIDKLTPTVKVGASVDKTAVSAAVDGVYSIVPKKIALPVLVDVDTRALDGLDKRLDALKQKAKQITVSPPTIQGVDNEYGLGPATPRAATKYGPGNINPFDLAPQTNPYGLSPRGSFTPQAGGSAASAAAVEAYGINGPGFTPSGPRFKAPEAYGLAGDLMRPGGVDPQTVNRSAAYSSDDVGPRNRAGKFEQGQTPTAFSRAKDSISGLSDRLGDFGKNSEKVEKTVKGAALAMLAVDGAASVLSAGMKAFQAITADTPEKAKKAVQEGQAAIESIPIVGGLASRAGQGIYSGLSATKNLFSGSGFKSDQTIAAETEEAAALQDKKAAKKQTRLDFDKGFTDTAEGNEFTLATSKLSAQDKAVADLLEKRRKMAEQIKKGGGGMANAKAALDSTDKLIADAQRDAKAQTKYEDDTARSDRVGIYSAMATNTLNAKGQTDRAGRMQIEDSTRSQVDAMEAEKNKLVASGDKSGKVPELAQKIQAIKLAGSEALAAYDEQLNRQRDEVIASSQSSAKQIRLRGAGKVSEAEEEGIRAGFRGAIGAANRNGDKATSAALEDQQSATIDESRRQRAVATWMAIEQADAQGYAAKLRMQGEGQKAELTLFDAATKARLDSLRQAGADQKQIDAEANASKEQRAEIEKRQQRDDKRFSDSMATRRGQAAANGEGMGALAGTLGAIAGMKAELADPNLKAGQRADLAQTQKAELLAMRSQMFAPNKYAEDLDRNRVAIGGPNGKAGEEDTAILKAIEAALATLNATVANNPKGLGS